MTKRSVELEEAILAGIADGITMREMCRRHDLSRASVHLWTRDPDFAARLAQARALGFDAIAEEMIEIADDSRNDWIERTDAADNTTSVRNPESVARSKLRIDTRLRLLAHWDPQRFSEKVPGTGGMRGFAGVIAMEGDGPAGATEPIAIAARIASLLTTIDARQPGLIEHRNQQDLTDDDDTD